MRLRAAAEDPRRDPGCDLASGAAPCARAAETRRWTFLVGSAKDFATSIRGRLQWRPWRISRSPRFRWLCSCGPAMTRPIGPGADAGLRETLRFNRHWI